MAGNVWEWVQDESPSGAFRVIRGGCWGFVALDCRSAFRGRYDARYRIAFFGFRLSRSLP